jgi:arsenite methyltransferase
MVVTGRHLALTAEFRHRTVVGILMFDSQRKGAYGVDAPYVPLMMGVAVLACVVAAVVFRVHGLGVDIALLPLPLLCYLHTTLRGKFEVWEQLLDGLELRGTERVLDLGCGRGAVLILAARRVPSGRAVGVDIWSNRDQSGNAMAACQRNALVEGVADRIELHTADMRALPFPDASVDVVVSNVAIHNIPDRAGRDRAMDEAMRVLRPGGRLLVTDIRHAHDYCERLRTLGATHVGMRGLGWRMWWGGPWMRTTLVEARKG